MITRTIDLAPFGKARPRVTRNGKRTFMPPAYEANKQALQYMFGRLPAAYEEQLLALDVTAVRPMPKSWSKKKRLAKCGTYAAPKPDIDNILGAVMDALFVEDSHVVETRARKIWGNEGRMIITVSAVNEEMKDGTVN